MSNWRSYLGGRYSPFHPAPTTRPPIVTDNDYDYVRPDEIAEPPSSTRLRNESWLPSIARHASRADADNPDVPDILVLKHRGTTHPLHFPAFCIGEGQLRVGELRRRAAQATDTPNPRRIKLLYKGKVLKDDAVACRDEGLKQNSELMCVVSEAAVNGGGGGGGADTDSSESADDDEMVEAQRNGGMVDVEAERRRKNAQRAKKGRKVQAGDRDAERERDRDRERQRERDAVVDDAGYLHPDRHARSGGGAAAGGGSASNATSRSNTPSNAGSSSTTHHPQQHYPPPPPSPRTTAAAKVPKTPMDRLDDIASTFHTQFVPKCTQYINSPPPDAKARDQEHLRLTEGIMSQVMLKLDEVETAGDEEARTKRKAIVKETQAMLAKLDAIKKR